MNHEQAVRLALTGGGLMPAEVKDHIEHCSRCREELDALRALEAEVTNAAPFSSGDAGLAAAFSDKTLKTSGRATKKTGPLWGWKAAAAGLVLAAGLGLSLSSVRSGDQARALMANLNSAEQRAADHSLTALGYGSTEDSTAALLGLTETSVGKEVQKQPPDELEDYLNPLDTGGWNG